jgi:hypothetical protein
MNPPGAAGMQHPAHVLDEDGPSPALDDDPAGSWPEVAGVKVSKGGPGLAVRLARDAAKYEVHASTKPSASEGPGIRP